MLRKSNFLGYVVLIILVFGVFGLLFGSSNFFNKDDEFNDKKTNQSSNTEKTDKDNQDVYVSFLGDSITTYAEYSNNGSYNSTLNSNSVYYNSSKIAYSDTWWYQTLKGMDYELCVNNSCDASRVTSTRTDIKSGVERASQLHNNNTGKKPDIVVIYMGTNDVGNSIALQTFEAAYIEMLDVVKTNYPTAEVYCCTLLPESRTEGRTDELEAYNESICSITTSAGYTVIDFYSEIPDWDYTSDTFVDGTLRVHPTATGMDKLSEVVIKALKG